MQSVLSKASNLMTGGAVLGALSLALSSSVYVVPGGHRAIIFDRFQGVMNTVKGEGMHLRIPIIQRPIMYEIRTRFAAIQSETGSRDLQTVNLVLRLLYRPVAEKLPVIHKTLGTDYDDKILPAIGNEVLKAVVAQYDAGQLITQRELVSTKIREILTSRAADFNITLDDVSITHLAFGKEFTNAIEAKQVAQQDTERSKYIVAKNEQEKLAEIIRASGEAEAARIIEEAMKAGQGFIELRKIQAAKDIAETLAKSRNVTYIPTGGNVLLNMGSNPAPRAPPPQDK